MFDNIPDELKALPRWVNFDITADKRKIPFTPGTNNCAKSDDPSSWRTFEQATKDVVDGKRQHLGLAIEKPFVFIDLDESHPEIEAVFDSYKQRSVSGGTHIIGRGHFEGAGIHPTSPAIGIFREHRFCLFTGNVVNNHNEIKDLDNGTLQSIYDWASGGKTTTTAELVEEDEERTDDEVLTACDKRFLGFRSLWEGNAGEDHSRSDDTLIKHLADETKSNEQVRRLFRQSALCRPHRTNDKYINYSLKKIRGKQEQFESIMGEWNDNEEPEKPQKRDLGCKKMIETMPEGLVKRLAHWVWRQAKFPLQEAGVASAITTVSTVVGRSYQLRGSGLNTWMILVAGTGVGKNEFQSGINKTVNTVNKKNTLGVLEKIFNGELASGQAVEDTLAISNRCCCYFPEFDDSFAKMSAKEAAPQHSSMKKALLNSFMISGKGNVLPRRLKAHQKGEDRNMEAIECPNLVVGGETTLNGMFGNLTLAQIESGMLQRFTVLQAGDESISRRTSPDWGMDMPDDLAEELLDLFVRCDEMNRNGEFKFLKYSGDAERLLTEFDHSSRDKALDSDHLSDAVKEYYTRAGIKASRIAGIFAVSKDMNNPVITDECAKWAIWFVNHTDNGVIKKFEKGMVGAGEQRQESEVLDMLRKTLAMGTKKRIQMGIPKDIASCKIIVPQNWLKSRIVGMPIFSSDRRGAVTSFVQTLKSLDRDGKIYTIPPDESSFGKSHGAMIGLNL